MSDDAQATVRLPTPDGAIAMAAGILARSVISPAAGRDWRPTDAGAARDAAPTTCTDSDLLQKPERSTSRRSMTNSESGSFTTGAAPGTTTSGESAIPPIAPYTYGWPECFSLLLRHGFAPRQILDVGANHGNWTRAAVRFFPSAHYVLVEPQGDLKSKIWDLLEKGHDLQWITAGVSDKAGQLLLTLAPDDVSSNFGMTPGEAAAFGYRQTPVEIRTINEIVASCGGVIPDMVKIDAEGYDLKALTGASDILGRTEIFFVEAAVCATGIENTMAAVIPLMTRAGYKLIDITDLNRSPKHGVLWLCELVFLRHDSPLLASVSSYR